MDGDLPRSAYLQTVMLEIVPEKVSGQTVPFSVKPLPPLNSPEKITHCPTERFVAWL